MSAIEGMKCPKCEVTVQFRISVTALALVSDAGVIDLESIEWDDESTCICVNCDHQDTVSAFHKKNEAAANDTATPSPATTGEKGGVATKYSERQQFLLDIMCGAIEGGTGYWAIARNVERDAELNYLSYELADAEDEADSRQDPPWHRVDAKVVELGIKRIREGVVNVSQDILARVVMADNSNDAGITDANDADCIVQAGIFNDIVYG